MRAGSRQWPRGRECPSLRTARPHLARQQQRLRLHAHGMPRLMLSSLILTLPVTVRPLRVAADPVLVVAPVCMHAAPAVPLRRVELKFIWTGMKMKVSQCFFQAASLILQVNS